jgi:hypothetical protein
MAQKLALTAREGEMHPTGARQIFAAEADINEIRNQGPSSAGFGRPCLYGLIVQRIDEGLAAL